MTRKEARAKRSADTPTGPSGTRLEHEHEADANRRSSGSTRRDDPSGDPLPSRYPLGPRLEARFEVLEALSKRGAEAILLLVRAKDGTFDGERVLKLYQIEVTPDKEALKRLMPPQNPEERLEHLHHVIELFEADWDEYREGAAFYELQEYCPEGSLRDLMTNTDPIDTPLIIEEVAKALQYAHARGLVHRDIKPANLLIRNRVPVDLVLGDFGVARPLDETARYSGALGTPAYMPPEAFGGFLRELPEYENEKGGALVSPAWDWWSLGMILAEIAAGRHPFEGPDGRLLPNNRIAGELMTREVDLAGVEDDRLRLLCRGLLTRHPKERWGAQSVMDWLAGASPPVADPVRTGASSRTVLFAGAKYATPQALAKAFQDHWDDAQRSLLQDPDDMLVSETLRLLRHHQLDEAASVLESRGSTKDLPRTFADLLKEMDPNLDPVYRGIALTTEGLEEAALQILRSGGDHRNATILEEVRHHKILLLWRDLPGIADMTIQERWDLNIEELDSALAMLPSQ